MLSLVPPLSLVQVYYYNAQTRASTYLHPGLPPVPGIYFMFFQPEGVSFFRRISDAIPFVCYFLDLSLLRFISNLSSNLSFLFFGFHLLFSWGLFAYYPGSYYPGSYYHTFFFFFFYYYYSCYCFCHYYCYYCCYHCPGIDTLSIRN